MSRVVPVLEVGGTHVLSALVSSDDWKVTDSHRFELDSAGPAAPILAAFVAAGARLTAAAEATWGVAMPDPFDYPLGIATFRGVGKFDSIFGVDVGAVLRDGLPTHPVTIRFVNDADAFILGEWTRGAGEGRGRCVGLTLGTGLGSGWLADGRITDNEAGVPKLGRARHLMVNDAGLEETMSRRAIRRAYAARTNDTEADVLEICTRARDGDRASRDVLRHALRGLGTAIGPALREFAADIVVVGGSMAGSWELLAPWFGEGLDWAQAPPVVPAADLEHAAVRGAARFAFDAWF